MRWIDWARTAAFLSLLWCVGARGEAPATAPASQPAATAPATTAPTSSSIPLGDLATQADAAAATVRGIEGELASDRAAATVASKLPALIDELDARSAETTKALRSAPSLATLRRLEEQWTASADTVRGWNRDLAKRAARLDQHVQRLNTLADTWRRALDAAQSAQAPTEVVHRAETTLAAAVKTRDAAERARTQTLALQARVSEEDARVADALSSVRAARDAAVGRLLTRDSPAVWEQDFGPERREAVMEESQQSLAEEAKALRDFLIAKRRTLLVHAAGLVALIPLGYTVRRRARKWAEEDSSLRRVAAVFDLPIATALVLALLVSGRLYLGAPRLFWSGVMAVALLPTILILRRILLPPLYPALYALFGFFLVDQLRAVLASQPLASRWLLMAEMLAAAGLLIWFVRSGRLAAAVGTGHALLAAFIRNVARVAVVVFATAFAAAAAGYLGLAALLGRATLGSAYLAVIFYAATRIADGLIMSALRARPLSLLKMVEQNRRLFWSRIRRVVHWGAALLWATSTLDMLSLRAIVVEKVTAILTARLAVGSFSLSLGQVIAFGLTLWAAVLLSRFLRFILDEDIYPRFRLERGLPYAISTSLHYVVLAIGVVAAIGALGYDLTQVTILAGAFGVGLGFGLQNIFNNFISGLILLFERPVRPGDVIQVDEGPGVVRRIGIRASVVRMNNGAEVILPNSKLIADRVTNWTFSGRRRGIELTLAVGRETDPQKVMDLWERIATAHPKVTTAPPPRALLTGLGGGSLTFELQAWVDDFDEWALARSDLALALNAALASEGIAVK